MLNTPILFLIFNRPQPTQRVFERIREMKPAKLYVAADGPRNGRPEEAGICEQTRKIIDGVDWPCEVKTLFRSENLGCGRAVSSAVSWFFSEVERGIILEDDILPHPDFFPYCELMLEKYKDRQDVMHINGCNFQEGKLRGDGSYYFSGFPHVWGWASWRRAWKHYDFNLSDLNYFYNLKKIKKYIKEPASINRWYEIFFKMNRKLIDTWDYQWNYAVWNEGGRVITPNVNLIENIGFGAGATHTTETESKFAQMKTFALPVVVDPSEVSINQAADQQTMLYCY
jgi:hypothetical protein